MKKNKIPIPPPPKIIEAVAIPPPPPVTYYDEEDVQTLASKKNVPNAIDLEKLVLGAMLIDSRSLLDVIDILSPEVFYEYGNGIIYKAILNLYNSNQGIDLKLISHELRRIGKLSLVGGDFYLVSLTQTVASTAHIEYHARIILQKYILRELISQSSYVISQSYDNDPDVFDIMDFIETGISKIGSVALKNSKNTVIVNAKEELREKVAAVLRGEPPGVYTSLTHFDNWCGGFQRRELITIAARPGMGKTTAILAIAANASFDKKIPIAIFSLEMASADLKARLASRGCRISYDKIRQGKLTPEELQTVMNYYDFIDNSTLTIVERMTIHEKIIVKIKDLVKTKGIKLAIIDYVQLIKLLRKSTNRTEDLSTITRDLKALSNELNIPIVIVAQLNRSVDSRDNKRPVLADLKQSGSIEEDSDTVIFLLRMAYYQQENGVEIPPHIVGKCLWIVAKGRNTGIKDFWTFLDFPNFDFRALNI